MCLRIFRDLGHGNEMAASRQKMVSLTTAIDQQSELFKSASMAALY